MVPPPPPRPRPPAHHLYCHRLSLSLPARRKSQEKEPFYLYFASVNALWHEVKLYSCTLCLACETFREENLSLKNFTFSRHPLHPTCLLHLLHLTHSATATVSLCGLSQHFLIHSGLSKCILICTSPSFCSSTLNYLLTYYSYFRVHVSIRPNWVKARHIHTHTSRHTKSLSLFELSILHECSRAPLGPFQAVECTLCVCELLGGRKSFKITRQLCHQQERHFSMSTWCLILAWIHFSNL